MSVAGRNRCGFFISEFDERVELESFFQNGHLWKHSGCFCDSECPKCNNKNEQGVDLE